MAAFSPRGKNDAELPQVMAAFPPRGKNDAELPQVIAALLPSVRKISEILNFQWIFVDGDIEKLTFIIEMIYAFHSPLQQIFIEI